MVDLHRHGHVDPQRFIPLESRAQDDPGSLQLADLELGPHNASGGLDHPSGSGRGQVTVAVGPKDCRRGRFLEPDPPNAWTQPVIELSQRVSEPWLIVALQHRNAEEGTQSPTRCIRSSVRWPRAAAVA